MRISFWERESLTQKRDLIIVGCGFVGLSAAIELKRVHPNKSILIVERQPLGAAASTRNAGFACFGSVSEIVEDIKRYGPEKVKSLVELRWSGIKNIESQFRYSQIDYVNSGGFEVFSDEAAFDIYKSEIKKVNELLESDIFCEIETPSPLTCYERCIFNKYEGQLNPVFLHNELIKEAKELEIEIIRGLSVLSCDRINEGILLAQISDSALEIRADQIVIATNALTGSLLPDLNVEAVRNQVLITTPIKGHGLKGCYHQENGYIYYRDIGDRVLIGGARHLYPEENTSSFGSNPENLNFLKEHLHKYVLSHVPEIAIDHHWSGILSGGACRLPIVKRHSDRVVIAVRLGGMGVAIGIGIGKEAATLLSI